MGQGERFYAWQPLFGGFTPSFLLLNYQRDRSRFLTTVLLDTFAFGTYNFDQIEEAWRKLPPDLPVEFREVPGCMEDLVILGRKVRQRLQTEKLPADRSPQEVEKILLLIAQEVEAWTRRHPLHSQVIRIDKEKGQQQGGRKLPPWMAHLDHPEGAGSPDRPSPPQLDDTEDEDEDSYNSLNPATLKNRPWSTRTTLNRLVEPAELDVGRAETAPLEEQDTLDRLPLPKLLRDKAWHPSEVAPAPGPRLDDSDSGILTNLLAPVRAAAASREMRPNPRDLAVVSLGELLPELSTISLRDPAGIAHLANWRGRLEDRIYQLKSALSAGGADALRSHETDVLVDLADGLAGLAEHAGDVTRSAVDQNALPWPRVRVLEAEVAQLRSNLEDQNKEVTRLRRVALWHHLQGAVARLQLDLVRIRSGELRRTRTELQKQWLDIVEMYKVLERKVPPEVLAEVRPDMERLSVAMRSLQREAPGEP